MRTASRARTMDSSHIPLATDVSIVAGSVILPAWISTMDAWAGAISIILGLVVVVVRLMIALRDWQHGARIKQEDVDVQ